MRMLPVEVVLLLLLLLLLLEGVFVMAVVEMAVLDRIADAEGGNTPPGKESSRRIRRSFVGGWISAPLPYLGTICKEEEMDKLYLQLHVLVL